MFIEILPNQIFSLPNVNAFLRCGRNSIIHKILESDLLNKDIYLNTAALVYIIKGQQVIKRYDGSAVTVEEGQLLFLRRDMYLVSDFTTREGVFEAVLFFIDEDLIHSVVLEQTVLEPEVSQPVMVADQNIKKYMHSLLSVYGSTKNDPRLLKLKLSELFLLIHSSVGGGAFISLIKDGSALGKKRNIADFMRNNYLNNLNIEDFALLTGRSRSTFIRDFKKVYGTTPNQWLIEQRLQKANQLLLNTEVTVTEVALSVGYENISHFITAYKRKYGVTPKQSKTEHMTQISY